MAKRPRQKPKFLSAIPKCADREQVVGWIEAADISILKPPICGFCTDCTFEYQEKMINKGLCENPNVNFFLKKDGEVQGVIA